MYLIKMKHDNYDGFILVDYESDDGIFVQNKEDEDEIETATNYILANNLATGSFFVSKS